MKCLCALISTSDVLKGMLIIRSLHVYSHFCKFLNPTTKLLDEKSISMHFNTICTIRPRARCSKVTLELNVGYCLFDVCQRMKHLSILETFLILRYFSIWIWHPLTANLRQTYNNSFLFCLLACELFWPSGGHEAILSHCEVHIIIASVVNL